MKHKYKYIFILQVILLIVYIILSQKEGLLVDFFENSIIFIAAFSLLNMDKLKKEKLYSIDWKMLSMVAFSYGFLELAWTYLDNFTTIDPSYTVLVPLFLIPNIFMLITLMIYFKQNIKKWNKIQFMADISIVFIIVSGLASGLFFTKPEFALINAEDKTSILLYLVVDLMSAIIMLVLYLSIRKYKALRTFYIISAGFFVYIIADIIYAYEYLDELYLPNSTSDILFMVSMVIFTFGAYMEAIGENKEILNEKVDRLQNIGKSKVVFWISPLPVFLFLVQMINVTHLAAILVAIIIYQFFDYLIQKSALSEFLLEQEHRIKMELEAIVEDRTKDFIRVNGVLQEESFTDSLTGIKNRKYFYKVVQEKMKEDDQHFSLLFINLKRFKLINDIHGHSMGDQVLTTIAKRFLTIDNPSIFVTRLGGDEFGIVYPSDELMELETLGSQINELINEPIQIGDYRFTVEASIGVSRYPKDATDMNILIKYASLAMHHAKSEAHVGHYVIHSTRFVEKVERRNHIEMLLKSVDFDTSFELYYQPQFELKSKALVGMEGLLRWKDINEGFISPGEFIPIAEEIGMIEKISDWVYVKGIQQIKKWNTLYNKNLTMSLNMSPVSLNNIMFIPNLQDLLTRYDVKPQWVGLEITENSAMTTAVQMEEFLTVLSNMGLALSIDDFGTGYSSLSYLKRFDIDVIKIARELIENLATDHIERQIVKAIINMARSMGIETLAEGVETIEQMAILEELECDKLQGFYLGRPVPAEEFEARFIKMSI